MFLSDLAGGVPASAGAPYVVGRRFTDGADEEVLWIDRDGGGGLPGAVRMLAGLARYFRAHPET